MTKNTKILHLLKNIAATLLLVVSMVQAGRGALQLTLQPDRAWRDFDVFYNAALVWRNGNNPYTTSLGLEPEYGLVFIYPMASLLFFVPMSYLPRDMAVVVMTVVSFLSFGGIVYLVLKIKNKTVRWWEWALITAFGIQTFSFKFNLMLVQVNLLVIYGLILSYYLAFEKKWRLGAGIVLGLSIGLKMIPLLLVPYLLLRKQYSVVVWTIVFFLLAHLPFGLLGLDYFTHTFWTISSQGTVGFAHDQSLVSILTWWLGNIPWLNFIITGLGVVGYSIILYQEKRNRWQNGLGVVLLLLAVVMATHKPFLVYYVLFFYPLVIYMWQGKWLTLLAWWLPLTLHDGAIALSANKYRDFIPINMFWYLGVIVVAWVKCLSGKRNLEHGQKNKLINTNNQTESN